MKPFYRFSTFATRTFFGLLYGVRLYGLENLDFKGPAILASNHISLCDPPLIGSFTPFEVHFMAKSELFRNKIFGSMIRALNAFPVRRGLIDRQALEISAKILAKGGRILIFPEGSRQKNGILGRGLPGMAKIALQNETPIVPVFINGANRLRRLIFSRRHIGIRYGKVLETVNFRIDLPEKERIRALTEKVMEKIGKLGDSSENRI